MYTSSTESETPPPVASSNYEAVVAEYNRQYMEPEFCDAMTEKMSIAHVDPILRQHGEYILYGTMIENGEKREKENAIQLLRQGTKHLVDDQDRYN